LLQSIIVFFVFLWVVRLLSCQGGVMHRGVLNVYSWVGPATARVVYEAQKVLAWGR